MTPREIQDRLMHNGIVGVADFRGCTKSEVEHLERLSGHLLPTAYKRFLLAVGHGAGAFLQGTDGFYDRVAVLTSEGRMLLTECGLQDTLPEDAFVFYMHQGYEFGYFRIGDGADPPVYQYVEGSGVQN